MAGAEPPVAVEAPAAILGAFHTSSALPGDGSAPRLGEAAGLAGGVVAWTRLVHCGLHGADLVKTGGVDRIWDAGAVSAIALKSGDGYLEFTASETTTSRMCGLSGHADPAHFHLVEYAFLLSWNGSAEVYEQGHPTGVSTGYLTGDEFRIAVEQGRVNYYKNGELLFTSGHKPLHRLLAVAAFWSRNATIRDAAMYGQVLARATA